MTLRQYKTVAKTVASMIKSLDGNPQHVRNLKFASTIEIGARDPNKYADHPLTFESGEENTTIVFDTISNPNNPNYMFHTLKPGSMSFYNSETKTNVDITDYNFDSAQFADLIDALSTTGWKIHH